MRGFIVTTLILIAGATGAAGSSCEGSASWTSCDVSNDGTQVDVGGEQTTPGGDGGGDGTGGGGGTGGDGGGGSGGGGTPTRITPGERGTPDCAPDAVVCVPVYEPPTDPEDVEEEDDPIPPVTIADLASFAPAAPALQAEPGAAGVVGMPTNFVAAAGEQSMTGTLFGRPVTVLFTPQSFVFDYGDGDGGRSATGGASWESLGQAQFTATPTSHAYAQRGSYTAAVSVEYAAAVDFGGGWLPVPGVVTATTGGYAVEVYEVRTGLVDRTCLENPDGPGC